MTHEILGLMSGTSLDGLDLAFCHIWQTGTDYNFKIKETKSVSYDPEMSTKLRDSIFLPAEELLGFHNSYGVWLGEQCRIFIDEHGLNVECIASHGHTTHHRPEMGLTFQIGSGQHLANASGHKVVCDFRTNDIALGGQGAPLVPIGDALFFSEYDFCLNLGGIANVSFDKDGQRIAYDIGLANMVLNHITRKNGLDYDEGGKLARSGNLIPNILKELNDLEYYRLPYPKSTGYEWFVEKVVPLIDAADDRMENLLHTCIHHICEQISVQVKVNSRKRENSLLVTGGGALNHFLIQTLQKKLGTGTRVVAPDQKLIEFKEALVFALMGMLRLQGETNVLHSVTGAKRDSSSGVLYLPN
ncbi:anhydro-N-acetylmuramic acid kinase [Pricia sp. S334]|uniref:Anhydro-N-acetylmuramic acid kinase n=1 Tax=Pricia mediterranea TaxID=3076079 RepID=A0ABU3LAD2_9FLAO|nr:anhydro-N-acetylmuramic acid kinase [Pricia sp. S334]MDT7830154.1 anhydro-N-acetylmuramic acid kinase [Pricia sp. S334]